MHASLQVRPSTHQLAAKYAAMLPLAAVDPVFANKEAAARQLKEWVHQRRTTVQQHIMSAAAAAGSGVLGGGSTLQDLPEMVVPYGLYILAHHPDFPQVRLRAAFCLPMLLDTAAGFGSIALVCGCRLEMQAKSFMLQLQAVQCRCLSKPRH